MDGWRHRGMEKVMKGHSDGRGADGGMKGQRDG